MIIYLVVEILRLSVNVLFVGDCPRLFCCGVFPARKGDLLNEEVFSRVFQFDLGLWLQ